MKRNPLLIVILILVILGALFFRYLSPSQSNLMAGVADRLHDKATELVADVTSIKEVNQKDADLKAEEAQLLEQRELIARADQKSDALRVEKIAVAAIEVEATPVIGETPQAQVQEGDAQNAIKRANDLLAQALKAADQAKEQIKIAQNQLNSDMRARPNLSLLQKSPEKMTEPVVEKKIKKEISPHAPLAGIEKVFAESVIRFDWTKSVLDDESKSKILNVADVLKANPDISVRVIGHTDGNGTDELNNWLGLIRARRVRQQLISNGVNPKRVAVSSRGSKDPIESNDSAMGRWKNRRVEFVVSEK